MKKSNTIITALTVLAITSACGSTDKTIHTNADKLGYEEKYDYNVDHMPTLDRQLLIRAKLRAQICDGSPVQNFYMHRKGGAIRCVSGANMTFTAADIKMDY